MYYPVQIPYILDDTFLKHIKYQEDTIDDLTDFVICYWQMTPIKNVSIGLYNIIILDGCIDLVVDFEEKLIGFSGMSSTDFHFKIQLPAKFMGLRLTPGAFHQLTKREPQAAMDKFLPISEVYGDFNQKYFFSLSFDEAKQYLIDFMKSKIGNIQPNSYTKLFNDLIPEPPASVSELCQILNLSQSQCQRNFNKTFGLSPKVVLSILRFQKSITLLTSTKTKPSDLLEFSQYYDQSHLINDFQRNIGLTPLELLAKYK